MPVVQDYTALLSDFTWSGYGNTNKPAIVTYSFETSAQSYLSEHGFSQAFANSFQEFSALDKVYTREAVNQWAQASGIVLIEVPAGQGDLKFAKYDFDYDAGVSSAAGFAYFPSRSISDGYVYDTAIGGDVFINTEVSNSVFLMLHEIGHALGLEHSFDGDNVLDPSLDNHSNTVMSYTGGGSSTLGYLDVLAARHIYGNWDADGDHVASWSWNAQAVELTQIGFNTGDDIYGTGVSDIIEGRGGNDRLAGFAGDDRLSGGSGVDRIFGGAGDDVLAGGAGNDYIYGGDYQGDGGAGDDTASFADDTGGVDADLSGSRWSGSVWYDAFGTVSGYDRLYDIDHLIGGSGNDRLAGNSAANRLEGGAGNDELIGGLGDDWLIGGAGDDALIGGIGNDTYEIDSAGDHVSENAGAGYDIVNSWISYELRSDTQNTEELTLLGSANLNGGGNGQNNIIRGNSGNNTLNGAWGNDTLYGNAGDDIFMDDSGVDHMLGGIGDDTYYLDQVGDRVTEYADEGYDVVNSLISYELRTHSQHTEELTLLGTADLYGGGNGKDNVIRGNSGNNTLNGAWGNDTLYGNGGDDVFLDNHGADHMLGGTGDDTYHLDMVGDRVTEYANEGYDVVNSLISYELRTHSQHTEELVLLGTADLYGGGNGQDNIIRGNSGNNTLNGAWGDDTLYGNGGDDVFLDNFGADHMLGGTGDDTYWIDNVGDRITEFSGEGYDVVNSLISYDLSSHSQHTEELTLTGAADIDGGGNDQNNIIRGNSGNNVLTGGAGDDVLLGGDGADVFVLSAGSDVVEDFEDGIDCIRLSNEQFSSMSITQQGGDVLIAANGDSLLLLDTIAATIDASDFDIFA